MKLSDLFEGFPTGKIRRSVKDTLPFIGVVPEIDNGNLYLNYRFGTTLASALSVANGEHAYNKQIPWHTQQTVAPYTKQELEIIKLACAQSGFTLDMLHDDVSHEPDWVNTVSPVAKLPMLESRRLLEAFGKQKLSTDIEATLPPVIVVPELNSGNNYPQYRFMTLMAGIRAIKNGDVPYRKLQPWSNSLAVVGYTPEDIETIRMAAAEAGFAIDEVNSSLSHEPDWVNTASPVMKFKMLEAAGDGMFLEPKTAQIHNLSPADDKAQSYQDTPTRGKPQILVVYPGRYQPLHRGHKAVFDDLVAEFGPNVYVSTSNKTDPDKSPFDFEDKLRMARAAGIPADKIQLVKNPYNVTEITDRFVPNNTVLLYAVGEKDMDTDPRFKFDEKGQSYKKDGSLSYLQKWPGMHKATTMDQHGYIIAAPTKEFTVLGEPATSATEIRKAYRSADPSKRDRIITDLYGKPRPEIRKMFDNKLGAKIDEDQPTYLQNPLDPEGDTNGPGKTGNQFTYDDDPVHLDDMNESKHRQR
jgi:Cytidylyltransferase-like